MSQGGRPQHTAGGGGRTLAVTEPATVGAAPAPVLSLGICAGLVAAVFVAYAPALDAEFLQWDDPNFITQNTHVHSLSAANLRWMLTGMHGGHFHPLTWLSWAIDYELWGGLKPGGFHFTNVALHAVCSVLFFFVLRRLLALAVAGVSPARVVFAAALGAGLFALHPLRVESVAWATERRDVLSTAFLFGAALAYLRAVNTGAPGLRSVPAYVASVVLLLLSCLSKAWGMSFFVILLVLDWYPLRRLPHELRPWLTRAAHRVLLEKVPFLIVGLATAVLAAAAQKQGMAVKTLEAWGVEERAVQSLYGLWFYVRSTVWPVGLSPFYQLPVRVDPLEPRFIAAYAFVAGTLVLLWFARKRWPAVVACAAIYGVSIAPVLGILQSGEQFVADRYAYIATAVFPALIAGGMLVLSRWASAFHAENRRPFMLLAWAAGAVVLLALGSLTFAQARTWHDTETLWAAAIKVRPESMPLTHYAAEMDRQGRKAEAMEALLAAVKLNPTDGRAWFTLGNRLRDLNRFADAEEAFIRASEHLPQAYLGFVNLGSLYLNSMNRPADAVAAFRMAVKDVERGGERPLSAGPYVALGNALRRTGDFDGARRVLTRALAFDETRDSAEAELKQVDEAEANATTTKPGAAPAPPTSP